MEPGQEGGSGLALRIDEFAPGWAEQRFSQHLQASIAVKQRMLQGAHAADLAAMAERITRSLAAGGKLMLCGNGGSAADAQHLAAELLIRLRPQVDRMPLPALTLATDTSTLTACGNDYAFEEIFARPLRALGRRGDVVLGITTSGRSPNVVKALSAAREMGITTLGFLGATGEPARGACDLVFHVPSSVTALVQEAHIAAGHVLMELIEDFLLGPSHP